MSLSKEDVENNADQLKKFIFSVETFLVRSNIPLKDVNEMRLGFPKFIKFIDKMKDALVEKIEREST